MGCDRVLLLAPSHGLGGGIERYATAIEAVLNDGNVPTRRINLRPAGRPLTVAARWHFVQAVVRDVSAGRGAVRIVIVHVNLLPVVSLVARLPSYGGTSVVVHGAEVWSGRRLRGRHWLRRRDVRVSAVSNFSAGALARTCRTNVLPPGIPQCWYETLVRAGAVMRPPRDTVHLLTAFRLGSWRSKGLEVILRAIESLRNERIFLTVCGTGPVPPELREQVSRRHSWCRIEANLSDVELAERFALADLFVLATRTQDGADASGEGFGLVLLEAQLAGTPVIAPAFGGSGDAFQPGMTGVAPVDESWHALAVQIADLVDDDKRRRAMGEAAAAWARERFNPETYGKQLMRTILG